MDMTDSPLMSSKSDEWATPQDLFDKLNAEFHFNLDAAANAENHKCETWLGPGSDISPDALITSWGPGNSVWLNPPYSMVGEFVAKAAEQQREGVNIVMLIPSRTDTRWFHHHIWDEVYHKAKPDVQIRFIRSRVKFVKPGGEAPHGAPFPSMVVIFKGRS